MDGKDWRARQAERAEAQRRAAHELAASFGARIYRFGVGWRVVGPSAHILVADLRYLERDDFVLYGKRG